ncbi:hypothetical protein Q4557_15250 [Shewanella sp. 5_MG-2023]|uniref:hypothetical protein n=1 Tax=Shewanella sp. 5_MG-2023 TaxID=3062656 RepID=UPI0026E2BFDB|nr:hypothetical protein [Shewanella sp. 5_MG-2023]MDO6641317.1 hypothetical protein [Shewanella sp. 5_MG-2023]
MKYANWQQLFNEQQQQGYYLELMNFLATERQQGKVIYPPENETFAAFDLTPLKQVKVVVFALYLPKINSTQWVSE